MNKKLIIAVVIIIALIGLGLVFAKDNEEVKEIKDDRQEWVSSKAYHAGAEYDVIEAKKLLQEKEKLEEEARLKVQAERQKIGSGLTQ